MSPNCAPTTIATIGIDLGKNTFHLVGLDTRGAIVLQLKLSRGQIERRLANVPCCLIGMEACSGAHHIGRRLTELGHDVRLIPAQYVKPFLKGHKNDYRDAEAIAEAVQRPTMRFVAIKTPEQMDLLALHRVRSRLVGPHGRNQSNPWLPDRARHHRTTRRDAFAQSAARHPEFESRRTVAKDGWPYRRPDPGLAPAR